MVENHDGKVVNGVEGSEGGLGCSATGNLPGVGVERRLITQISRSAALVGKLAAEVPLSEIAKLFVGTS